MTQIRNNTFKRSMYNFLKISVAISVIFYLIDNSMNNYIVHIAIIIVLFLYSLFTTIELVITNDILTVRYPNGFIKYQYNIEEIQSIDVVRDTRTVNIHIHLKNLKKVGHSVFNDIKKDDWIQIKNFLEERGVEVKLHLSI